MSVSDLQSTNNLVYGNSARPLRRFSFIDSAEVTQIDIGFVHLLATTSRADRIMGKVGGRLRTSCHAPSDLTFGMARTFCTLMENTGWADAFVSRDRTEAKDWLGLGPLPFD